MHRRVASGLAALCVAVSCTPSDVTAPKDAAPGARAADQRLRLSASEDLANGLVTLPYPGGHWVEFDLNMNQIRSSYGTVVTDVPADTMAMLASEAAQINTMNQALAQNSLNWGGPLPCWMDDGAGGRIPCPPEYAQSDPNSVTVSSDSFAGIGRETGDTPILLRIPKSH